MPTVKADYEVTARKSSGVEARCRVAGSRLSVLVLPDRRYTDLGCCKVCLPWVCLSRMLLISILLRDGKLREYITIGVTAEEFKARLKASLEDTAPQATSQTPQESHVPTEAAQYTPARSPSAVPSLDTGPREPETEAQRRAGIRAGKKPVREENEQKDNPKSGQDEWRKQQRKISQQRKEDKQRVLEQIKRDKMERKQREAPTKASSGAQGEAIRPPTIQPLTSTHSQQVRLQVRLFDGTSIRSTFSPTQTIRHDIRPWIDEKRSDGAAPYTLKQILAPHPNRPITTAEENSTLKDLKLGSTANLIIVPVKAYAEAYPTGSSSLVRRFHTGYQFLFNIIAAIAEIIMTFLGMRQAPTASGAPPPTDPPTGAPTSRSVRETRRTDSSATGSVKSNASGLNIRTLRDQRDEQGDDEFYNGNQVRIFRCFLRSHSLSFHSCLPAQTAQLSTTTRLRRQ
jgi:hypothetical protein